MRKRIKIESERREPLDTEQVALAIWLASKRVARERRAREAKAKAARASRLDAPEERP